MNKMLELAELAECDRRQDEVAVALAKALGRPEPVAVLCVVRPTDCDFFVIAHGYFVGFTTTMETVDLEGKLAAALTELAQDCGRLPLDREYAFDLTGAPTVNQLVSTAVLDFDDENDVYRVDEILDEGDEALAAFIVPRQGDVAAWIATIKFLGRRVFGW